MDTTSKNSTTFKVLLDSYNLTQHVVFPTHVQGYTLDLFISPVDFKELESVSCGASVSDHFSVTCLFNFSAPTADMGDIVSFCQYNKINISNFKLDL